MLKLVSRYKNKLTFLFLWISVFAVATPLATGWMMYGITRDTRQIYVYIPDKEGAININRSAASYSGSAEMIRKSLKDLLEVVYQSRNLQSTLAEELLESGITVDNFAVKPLNAANKPNMFSNEGNGDWRFFNFAAVSLSGLLAVDKIPQLMFFLATRPKLWYISALNIQPMDMPADLVSRFQKIEMDITAQGRTFERDSLVELIERRAHKNTMSVSMTFIVPIALEAGVI
jgi:hypothetical protein